MSHDANNKDEEIKDLDDVTDDIDKLEEEIEKDLSEINKEIEEQGFSEGLEKDKESIISEENDKSEATTLSGEPQESQGELEEKKGKEMQEGEEKTEKKKPRDDKKAHEKNVVEAALFVAGRPISLDELSVKTEIRKKELEEILNELIQDYKQRMTALEIIKIQDKYSLQIKPEYTPKVKKFASGGLIPEAILKTLTIIALKQPILKSTLVKLRGSGAYEHVKFLLDRGYISATKKGRSYELMTTNEFADTFGLPRDISELKKHLIAQLGIKKE